MWNLISSNKILDIKWKRENQRKHISALQNIKSQVDTSSPNFYSFLESRPKARQLRRCTDLFTQSDSIKLKATTRCWFTEYLTKHQRLKKSRMDFIGETHLILHTPKKCKSKSTTAIPNLSKDLGVLNLSTQKEEFINR
jgi:hypothetical protein